MSEATPEDDVEMGFFDHVGELRKRLVLALVGLVPGVAVAWAYKERLLELALEPMAQAYEKLHLGRPEVHFANPIDPFVAYLQLSLVCGLLAASPWVFWQLWAFVAPGLYRRERLLAIPFVLASTLFFAGGAVFGYLVVFPLLYETLLAFSGSLPSGTIHVRPTLMISEVLAITTRMLLAFGVVFEVPVIVTFLSALRIVTARRLLSFGRWWIVIAAILAAILTPPDVGSQLLMLGPLVALYFLSVGAAYLIERFRRAEAPDQSGTG